MSVHLGKLLSEGKTYLWVLRHAQILNLTPDKAKEIKDSFAAEGIDLATIAALRQLEHSIARFTYPSVQHAHHRDYFFLPIPAFEIEVYFKTMITEQGIEVGMELFPSYLDWQFCHDEIQCCIGGDTKVEIVLPDNRELSRRVRGGDVVVAPAGTNLITHSSEEGGKFGHAHIFLSNSGDKTGQIFYDVDGLLRLQSHGMIDAAPPGALPFNNITDRIEIIDWNNLLTVHEDRERDLPSWLRRGWSRREEMRAIDYAEGSTTVVLSSPDRDINDFIEWGRGKRQCFVNPLIAEQMAAVTDCRFPAGYKRLHPHKEIWLGLKGQAKIKQSVPPLHNDWVEIDLKANDVMVAANGAHFHVLEATDDFTVRRVAETCAHNGHAAMMERKLEVDGIVENL